ncbi:hypothetical protein GOODEAATRI_031000 [Goodea atripinnis]|uniref:Uncharacterized protein n=1 Tax=Goodea atripinnis TaxID=208336 RepID=A0ABV0PT33_9TELE
MKMRGHGFPWSKLLMVLLVFAAGFIAHDISGEVSVSCLRGHAVYFTNSTWQLLQHTTSAIKSWAQELLTRAG